MMRMRIWLAAAVFMVAGALAMPARAADVHVGINIGVPPPVVFESPPRLVAVPEAPQVMYAPDAPVGVFVYGDQYYAYNEGRWFVTTGGRGPWTYVDRHHVPREVLRVPTRYYGHGPHHGDEHHGHGHHEHHDHDDHHHDDD